MASSEAGLFFVYIVRCCDGSRYVGHTQDVQERLKAHNDGRGTSWTACRRPVELVYRRDSSHPAESGCAQTPTEARWTYSKKLALINGDLATSPQRPDASGRVDTEREFSANSDRRARPTDGVLSLALPTEGEQTVSFFVSFHRRTTSSGVLFLVSIERELTPALRPWSFAV